jgi:hypothetical protein
MIDLKTYPLYPATPQTDYLRHAAGRVAHWPNSGRGILDDELLMPYGVPAFDSCGSMWPLTTWKLFKDTGRLTNAAALGIGAVTHVLSPTNNFPTDPALELVDDRDGVRIYRNTLALPRARFVSQYRNVASVADCKAIMARPDWQPLAMPLIETDRPAAATNAAAQVRIVAETTTEVELTVQADTAGYVVLADTFYPGWECSVDGRPTPVLRANGAQRAALVEPGHHRVRFQYAPASIRLGAIISGATLLLCVGGWFKRGRS